MRMSKVLCTVLIITLAGCSNLTSLYFYPQQQYRVTPDFFGLEWRTIKHEAADGVKLTSWYLPAKKISKGTVLFLHGNAQNISTHITSVKWLPDAGYNVFLLDYREYGKSEGLAKLPQVLRDIDSALGWVVKHSTNKPIFLLGQSIGAALTAAYVPKSVYKERISGVVLDACLLDYQEIARQSLSQHWLTWPLMLPTYLLPSEPDPQNHIANISPIPLFMMHSRDDQVIPYEQGKAVYELAQEPKQWLDLAGAHIQTFQFPSVRDALLTFMNSQ
jgi:fermentation-respiration switch protein FrsA (DUF1100 family)